LEENGIERERERARVREREQEWERFWLAVGRAISCDVTFWRHSSHVEGDIGFITFWRHEKQMTGIFEIPQTPQN